MAETIFIMLRPPYKGGSTYNLALIDHAVSEKKVFENNGHIHVNSPGTGADKHLGSKYFQKCKSFVNRVICCKFVFRFNNFVRVFPHLNILATKCDLAVKWIKVNSVAL